jgi:dipeptidyl aminopeptidase/acylaminoacyl peptidase
MRTAVALCLAVLGLLRFAHAQKHPLTFEDMMSLRRVEEPEVSPDGKWVLFAAIDVDLKANTKTPHVWVVPLSSTSENTRVPHPGVPGTPGFGVTGWRASPVLARVGDNSTADPTTATKDSPANSSSSLGMRDSREREIISDQDADRPRWAPDGKRFAFVSSKDDGSQIWIADFDGATGTVTGKHKLTSIATEADGELWSPDGKNILFKSDVYPECYGAPAEEDPCNARKLEEAKNSKVKAQIFTHLLYRHWNAYKEGKRTHLFRVQAPGPGDWGGPPIKSQGQPLVLPTSYWDLTPGDYDAPVFSLGGQDDYAFSPDGQEICYASNHDPEPAISTNNDLWIAPVNGGTAKDITAENKAADNTPLYSPDGKYIAYRAQQRPGYESDRWRLMLYDRKTEKSTDLTSSFDHWVGSFAWTRAHEVLFTSEDDGSSPIYDVVPEVCLEKCHPLKVLDGSTGDIAAFETKTDSNHGTRSINAVFTQMSIGAPNETYISDHGSCQIGIDKMKAMLLGESKEPPPSCAMSTARQLTHLNDSVLSQISMSPLESFWFTGANNDKVQGFLVKPPNFDPSKKYPVKFIIHGGPEVPLGDEWSYRWNAELFAANGYVVIFINFHGSPGYGQKFIDAINGDWGGAPFEDLMKGLDYAEQHYAFIDKDRECALGASYGGYMANWILGHTNRFKCIVSHDGMFNTESAYGDTEELWFPEWEFKGTPWTNREMYKKWSPHLFATNFKTPTLVIHGQLDYRLDVSQGFDLFTTLQRQGVPSKMLYFPDEGHWVLKPQNSQLWYKTVNDWVDQWVGK